MLKPLWGLYKERIQVLFDHARNVIKWVVNYFCEKVVKVCYSGMTGKQNKQNKKSIKQKQKQANKITGKQLYPF